MANLPGLRYRAPNIGNAMDFLLYWAFNRVPSRPNAIRIETTNHCNLGCITCDRNSLTRNKKLMSWDVFTHICKDAIDAGIPFIGLNRFGEPMLHPRKADMVAFAKENGAKTVSLTTNATLLNEKRSTDLLKAGIDHIAISIDGLEKETFEEIRVHAEYEQVIGALEEFLVLRDRISPKTEVVINYACVKQNIDQVHGFSKRWKDKVDKINFMPFRAYGDIQGLSHLSGGTGVTKCPQLEYLLTVAVDGRAGVCCVGDPDFTIVVGDLTKQSVMEVWNGAEIERIRRLHFAGKVEDLPEACQKCDLTKPYSHWILNYLSIYRHVLFGSGRKPTPACGSTCGDNGKIAAE